MASKAFRDLDKEKNGVISRSQFLKVGDTHAHTFFFLTAFILFACVSTI